LSKNVKVKICGITRKKDLNFTVDAGADAIGFIVGVPSSPRNISVDKALNLVSQIPVFTKSVLVMVPNSLEEIINTHQIVDTDAIQIHGDIMFDTETIRKEIPSIDLIRAVNLKSKALPNLNELARYYDAILLDSYVPGRYGGTGMTQNWSFSSNIRKTIKPRKMILAGGLNPSNIQEAIKKVKPYAVDVSTGVESNPGVKDPEKVTAFIKNAKDVQF
jgi:phosphoribosylanthranilate isomerase